MQEQEIQRQLVAVGNDDILGDEYSLLCTYYCVHITVYDDTHKKKHKIFPL